MYRECVTEDYKPSKHELRIPKKKAFAQINKDKRVVTGSEHMTSLGTVITDDSKKESLPKTQFQRALLAGTPEPGAQMMFLFGCQDGQPHLSADID